MALCRSSCVLALALLGCSVDSDSGFTGVSGGSAATTLPATSTAAGSETSGSEGASAASESESASDPSAADSTSAGESGSASTGATAESGSEGASSEGSSGGDGTPLDPQLDVPDMGEHCTNPGDLQECAGIAVCRFATVEFQTAFELLRLGRVTLVTVFRKHRPDLGFEEGEVLLGKRRGGRGLRAGRAREEQRTEEKKAGEHRCRTHHHHYAITGRRVRLLCAGLQRGTVCGLKG